jgi:hypothetical protein
MSDAVLPVRRAADWPARAVLVLVLFAATGALFATAPMRGDFWWSDAPRHALNGAFVKDFVAAMPLDDPAGWAVDYYLRYPALSILFYPPLFYGVEAIVYAFFGVSHTAAQATVLLFIPLLGAGAYGIARSVLPRWSSLGVALLAMGAPETAFWARQVMLDVPSYACLVTGAYFFCRYAEGARPRYVYLALLFVLAAVYIKLNAVFIAPVLALAFVIAKGRAGLRDRHALAAGVLGVIGLVPALLLTLKFGAVNVESVAGRQGDLSRFSPAAWLFYGEHIPAALGYAGALLACIGLILLLLGRTGQARWFAALLIGWFVFGYVFVSMIGVREPRHGLMMLFPLILCTALALHRFLPERWAQAAMLILGAATFGSSVIAYPPPSIGGYDAVVDYVASHAPKNAIVLFSGYRDGNFVFDLRTHEERRDIVTVRADKLLLKVAVERSRGVGQQDYDEAQIAKLIRDLGVDIVVVQPHFWDDLREMARFGTVIHSADFERVASFDISGTVDHPDKKIEIYRPTYAVERTRRDLQLDMPIIRDRFKGSLGPN